MTDTRKILDFAWRNSSDCVGFVLVQSKAGYLQAYVGVGRGFREERDIEWIADWGARLSFAEALPFFPRLAGLEKEYGEEGR